MFRPDHHHLRRDFSPPDSTSSSSFLIPFDSTTPTTTTNTTTWNPNLFPSPDLHFPSFPFSPFSLHDEISHLLPPPPDELLLLPSSYISTPPSVWTPRSRPDASTLALSLASSNPPNRWLPVQAIPAAGPLGPFTGYAAILKNSKFLRPAQQLLDEFCHAVTGSRPGRVFDAGSSSSSDPPDPGYAAGGRKIHQRPEFEHLKNKLLYMQEEVCKRYKQYHQQMQMVVSSFETVAGLSSATPYTTLALKAVSKHFRSLKSAISDQLRHVCNVLGEELMASSPTSCKNDSVAFPKLKYGDPNLRRQKSNDGSLGFSDNSHPVWRPQRGLPERAVSVLRAWLFDHFLHPYPTDTDKHMLATQTGLSRNQVSNWFINARVRLWKPMVEEIHSLETKGMAGMDLNSSIKGLDKSVVDQRSDGQLSRQADGSEAGELIIEKSARCAEPWHPDKRSRMEECAMDAAGLMSFAYQGAMDIGGLGAVSLTLGLRQGEGLQQHQEEEQQLRRFGHQMLHDFVG